MGALLKLMFQVRVRVSNPAERFGSLQCEKGNSPESLERCATGQSHFMKASKRKARIAPEIGFYEHFIRLDRERHRRIAVRILRNQKLMADLYDHSLIRRSLDEPGQNVAWPLGRVIDASRGAV